MSESDCYDVIIIE